MQPCSNSFPHHSNVEQLARARRWGAAHYDVRHQVILGILACYTYNQAYKGDHNGPREGKLVLKTGIFAVALLANAVALFCVFNPWIADWQGQGIVLLIVEAAAVVVIGAPVFFYHFIHEKKPLRQSLEDAARIIMDFLVGWV